jgi:hypothetical protein
MSDERVHTEITENHGEPPRNRFSHDEASQPVPQAHHIEIQQQANSISSDPQVGQKLRPMHRKDAFHRLDLNNQLLIDDNIRPEAHLQRSATVTDGHCDLPLNREGRLQQFKAKTFLIDRFQQSRPRLFMDFDRQTDHALRQFAANQYNPPQWPSVVPSVLRVEPNF